MKPLRLLGGGAAVYEGELVLVPRVGDGIQHDDQVVQIEVVTWDSRDDEAVIVTLLVGNRPYTFSGRS